MSTAGAVFADKAGFSAGAYIISLTLSLSDAWIESSLSDQSSKSLSVRWSLTGMLVLRGDLRATIPTPRFLSMLLADVSNRHWKLSKVA